MNIVGKNIKKIVLCCICVFCEVTFTMDFNRDNGREEKKENWSNNNSKKDDQKDGQTPNKLKSSERKKNKRNLLVAENKSLQAENKSLQDKLEQCFLFQQKQSEVIKDLQKRLLVISIKAKLNKIQCKKQSFDNKNIKKLSMKNLSTDAGTLQLFKKSVQSHVEEIVQSQQHDNNILSLNNKLKDQEKIIQLLEKDNQKLTSEKIELANQLKKTDLANNEKYDNYKHTVKQLLDQNKDICKLYDTLKGQYQELTQRTNNYLLCLGTSQSKLEELKKKNLDGEASVKQLFDANDLQREKIKTLELNLNELKTQHFNERIEQDLKIKVITDANEKLRGELESLKNMLFSSMPGFKKK